MRLALALIALVMAGCAAQTAALREQAPAGLSPRAELTSVPFHPQTEHHCGPAALATVLGAAGVQVSPQALGSEVFLPSRQGSLQVDMLAGARRHGTVPTRIPDTLKALLEEVDAGHPVLVLLNLGLSWAPRWHYAVVVGYDLPRGEVLLRSGARAREALPMRTFEHTWVRAQAWAFTALPPGQWPRTATEASALEAALGFERAVAEAAPREALYASALQRWPASLGLAIGLGNARHALGDKAGAAAVFEAAATRHRHAAAWVNLAATRLELGQPQRALQAALEAEAAALRDPRWQAQAALVLQQAKQAAGSRQPVAGEGDEPASGAGQPTSLP